MPENYDVVIVGAGPVGLMFAACMSRLGNYKIKHIDNREEPTQTGRAGGIQARTMDVLKSLGLKRQIMAYDPGRVYEVAFWNVSPDGTGIQRTGTWKSYPEFIDTRCPFSTIIHQGRIEKVFLDDLNENEISIDRPFTFSECQNNGKDPNYPVEVTLAHVDGTSQSTVRTKYLFGADGARSDIREHLGINMAHKDPTVHVWSVIDGVVKTDFPDIGVKCTVHSANGSSMIIPHGHNVVRIYVQIFLQPGDDPRIQATKSKIQEAARKTFSPYYIEWESVDWHSAYRIGQGVADKYSLDQRIFIGGDACHTHSPKAGQGMNYGFLDAHNLAWKMHLVESGFMKRTLLTTYEKERRIMAERLINFDAKYAGLFSSKMASAESVQDAVNSIVQGLEAQSSEFVKTFKQSTEFTSGYSVEYPPSCLVRRNDQSEDSRSPSLFSPPGVKLKPGKAFPVATVTRVVDARVAYLEQEIPFNASFRIYIFAGNPTASSKAVADLATGLQTGKFILSDYQYKNVDLSYDHRHNPHSSFFTFSVIFDAQRGDIEIHKILPEFLAAYRHQIYTDDRTHGKYATGKGSVHSKMGFDPEKGGVVVVRPDGHIACTLALSQGSETMQALNEYFGAIVASPSKEECRANL